MKEFCFNFERLKDFNTHVRRHLPWYNLVLDALEFFTACYLNEKGLVYDIGSGTGNYYKRISNLLDDRDAGYIGIEKAEGMYEQHKRAITRKQDELYQLDVRNFQFIKEYDICVVNLMLMFLPYKDQGEILDTLLDKMSEHGVLLLVEKDFIDTCQDSFFRYALERLTMYLKIKQGVSKEEVIQKELSLLGIQRPVQIVNVSSKYVSYEWFRLANFSGKAIMHAR